MVVVGEGVIVVVNIVRGVQRWLWWWWYLSLSYVAMFIFCESVVTTDIVEHGCNQYTQYFVVLLHYFS